jgi:hypothetical protein
MEKRGCGPLTQPAGYSTIGGIKTESASAPHQEVTRLCSNRPARPAHLSLIIPLFFSGVNGKTKKSRGHFGSGATRTRKEARYAQ